MAIVQLAPAALARMVQTTLVGQNLYLGIIPNAGVVAPTLFLTDTNAVIAAEFNAATWVRPLITLPTAGSYNAGLGAQILPGGLQWNINPPITVTFRQIFMIVGGSPTPRNTTGEFFFFFDYGVGAAITAPTGVDTPIIFSGKVPRVI